jgi:ATP-binding cassette subfamily B protein
MKIIRIKQRDISDCGAACLASVSSYYGLHLPVSRIREYAGTGRMVPAKRTIDAAEQLKFQLLTRTRSFHYTNPNTGNFSSRSKRIAAFCSDLQDNQQKYLGNGSCLGKMIRYEIDTFNKQWSGIVLLLIPSMNFCVATKRNRQFWSSSFRIGK